MIQSYVVIRPSDGGDELRVRLRDVSDGRGRHKVNDAVFDLARVLRTARFIHDLDATE